MKRQIINFKNKLSSYSIIIGENALDQLTKKISILCPKTRKIALIIDENVPVKFKNGYEIFTESAKGYVKPPYL